MRCDSTEIWLQYQDELYRFIRKKMKQEEDAKDVMQDVWLKLLSYCCGLGKIENMRAWLFRISSNTIADFYRRKTNLVFSAELPDEYEDAFPQPVLEETAAVFMKPFIEMLPDEYSQPLQMDSLMGMKQEQIAEKLNLEHGTIRTRLHRARKMLKAKIEECVHVMKDAAGRISHFEYKENCNNHQKASYKPVVCL